MKPASSSLAKTGAIALVIAAAGIGSALAASGSSGSGAAPIVCKKGYVYSQKSHTCVQANSGLIDDKDLYEQGRALAKAGYYEQALAALHAVKKQDNSMVLTMIGYSNRKMGNVAEGMTYYQRALAIDPNNINTREYLGEGYLTINRTDLALAELGKIEKICGTDCEQYETLSVAIAGGPTW